MLSEIGTAFNGIFVPL